MCPRGTDEAEARCETKGNALGFLAHPADHGARYAALRCPIRAAKSQGVGAVNKLSKIVAGLMTIFCLAGVAPGAALAQETMVVVPDHPGGGVVVNGCFRATQNLFGPYRLTFCLERRGTYEVRGGGLRCDGRLTHRGIGRDIHIELQRATCGRGRAWEAASIECRHSGRLLLSLAIPRLSTLSCTYFPSVRGVNSRTFTARRQ